VISSRRRLVGLLSSTCALGATTFVALPAGVAQAGLFNFGACNTSALSQPFAPWGDNSSYELAPGGDFETSTWNLSGGAQIVSGSEPFAATGTLGQSSLLLPAGASARSPSTCIDAAYPTVRMFVGGTGSVAVAVIWNGIPIPAGVAPAGGTWTPTLPMVTQAAIVGGLSGGTAQVSLDVTALSGNPQVDDVFIDPWNRG
jgi:hypothetical protein